MLGSNEMVMTLREDVHSVMFRKTESEEMGRKGNNKRNEAICPRIPISDERLLKRLAKFIKLWKRKGHRVEPNECRRKRGKKLWIRADQRPPATTNSDNRQSQCDEQPKKCFVPTRMDFFVLHEIPKRESKTLKLHGAINWKAKKTKNALGVGCEWCTANEKRFEGKGSRELVEFSRNVSYCETTSLCWWIKVHSWWHLMKIWVLEKKTYARLRKVYQHH